MPPSVGLDHDAFLREYVEALHHDSASVFVGAGLSVGAGFVDWAGLLRPLAEELGLDLAKESDLPLVAQFHLNAQSDNRDRLNKQLVRSLGKGATLSDAHHVLARLPFKSLWTSNYDKLLEEALALHGRSPDVKHKDDQLALTKPSTDVKLYKIAGDIDDPNTTLITKEDYDRYHVDHSGMLHALEAELTHKSFLFLGFSFADPLLGFILGTLRARYRSAARTHYAIMKRATDQYEENVQRHRVQDLKRYGVQTVLVDDYGEIPLLLAEIEQRFFRRSVFVSGSAHDYEPLGESRVKQLCRSLGQRIVRENLTLVSGIGSGIGSDILIGALSEIYAPPYSVAQRDRLWLRPFPQSDDPGEVQALWERYRQEMIGAAGFVIVIAGNKDGSPVADGVLREVEIAREHSKFVIPVGASGSAALEAWKETSADIDRHLPGVTAQEFGQLNDESVSNDEWIDLIVQIIRRLAPDLPS